MLRQQADLRFCGLRVYAIFKLISCGISTSLITFMLIHFVIYLAVVKDLLCRVVLAIAAVAVGW